jgi:hypothetical protein
MLDAEEVITKSLISIFIYHIIRDKFTELFISEFEIYC